VVEDLGDVDGDAVADHLPLGPAAHGRRTDELAADFSRATSLTVKTLRYYHRVGLLEPAEVDPHTGYRRYTLDQIPAAQIIRRFRDLDMPVEQVQSVLATPDVARRNKLIAEHLTNLEDQLTRTRTAVDSLRDLLQPSAAAPEVIRRQIPATAAAAVSETIDTADAFAWLEGALGELWATAAAQPRPRHVRHPPCPRRRRTAPRVLRVRPPRDRRRITVAHRDRLAHLHRPLSTLQTAA
jgi:DNA-binding transcriptional MerR regulator